MAGQWQKGDGLVDNGSYNFIVEAEGVSSSWVWRHGRAPPPSREEKSCKFGKHDGLSKYGKNTNIYNYQFESSTLFDTPPVGRP